MQLSPADQHGAHLGELAALLRLPVRLRVDGEELRSEQGRFEKGGFGHRAACDTPRPGRHEQALAVGDSVTVARVKRVTLAAALALAAGLAGCGEQETADYQNKPRPPAPINITAAIDNDRVRASPVAFGSGPVVIIISNQSTAAQRVTFETDEIGGDSGGITRSTGEIAARSTGQLKVDPPEGTYTLSASTSGITAATLEVGERRESAQNDLLQP